LILRGAGYLGAAVTGFQCIEFLRATNYKHHNQDALFALTKAPFALFPFRAEKMEYFRFWRIYLSGVEVSDLQEWERDLSTSRLHIAIQRVSFRMRVCCWLLVEEL